MGKPTGFIEYLRELPVDRTPQERVRDWKEFHHHMEEKRLRNQAARCMDCGVPFCHTGKLISGMASGCPINNVIPGMERPGLSRPVARSARSPAHDQQLPGVHRPRVPRAVRRLLRARHHESAGHDQDHRERDHRSRLGRRLGAAGAAEEAHGQESRRDRLRPRGPGGGRATESRRPSRSRCSNAPIVRAAC